MSKQEEKWLLKKLAQAHAFIEDVRRVAIARGDSVYIRKTSGIEPSIQSMRSKFPKTYQLFLTKARKQLRGSQKKE